MNKLSIKNSLYYGKRINMLACTFVRGFVKLLNVVLFLLLVVLLIVMVLKLIGVEVINGVAFDGFVKVVFAVVTLFVANLQISRHLAQAAVDSILKLRDNFNEEPMRMIQDSLRSGVSDLENEFDLILLFNFLGYIEVGSIMLQRGVLTREQFRNQFRYILGSVISNQWYVEHIIVSATFYDDLLFAIRLEFPDFCIFDK